MINQEYTFESITTTPVATGDSSQTVTISRVLIPKIQRAYAQGRIFERETRIRNQFIDAIFNNLQAETNMDLHFIYGAISTYQEEGESKNQLVLLDGQQRFTTLYLLHWYLINREKGHEAFPNIISALRSFVYETRTTTTEFCKSLADFTCDLDDKKPSEAIKKARWYYRRFDKDSSIQGMLVMLDAIHDKYNKTSSVDLLSGVSLLHFYVLPLVDYKMSEELYIKMNERGLPLTPFDNFKAEFTGAMLNAANLNDKVKLDDDSEVTHRESISVNLDTKWIDIFWNPEKTNYDISYMRFFSRFFAYRYILDSGKTANEIQDDKTLPINLFYTQSEDKKIQNEYLGFEKYSEVLSDTSNSDYFLMIERILNVLHEDNYMSVIKDSLTPIWDSENKENFFIDADVSFSQSLLVVFGAICEFILAFKQFDIDTFKNWMRIVWNVVENTNIDSLRAATGPLRNLSAIIKEVAELMGQRSDFRVGTNPNSNNLNFFAALSNIQRKFDQRAITEEIQKSKCISVNNKWLGEFILAEKHPYLKGSVAFFFDENMTINEFIHNRDLVMDMFNENGITDNYKERHVLIRAIISNLKTWDEKGLQDRYITERAETNKRLKLLLLGNDDVRRMFLSVLDGSKDSNEVKRRLYHAIAANIMPIDKDYWANKFILTHNALCTDVRLYDWMETQSSPVCVSEYKGHYAVSIRGVWYDRFIIDSERDKMANSLMPPSGIGMFYFGDSTGHATQKEYEKYHRYMATNVILFRNLDASGDISFRVGFMQDHRVRIYVQCNNEQQCNNVGDAIERQGLNICTKVDKDEKRLYLDVDEDGNLLPDFRYLLKNEFENNLKSKIYNRFTAVELAINQKQ